MSELRTILERIGGMVRKSDLRGWEDPATDAIHLSWYVERLVSQVHVLNQMRPEPKDLCPACAGETWGRPSGPDGSALDWRRRKCRECGELRPEPKDQKA